jgi:hypothetical protein
MATPLAAAAGAETLYTGARVMVPYVAYLPHAELLGSRLVFGLRFNVVDALTHAGAFAAAVLVLLLLATLAAMLVLLTALTLVVASRGQPGSLAGRLLFGGTFFVGYMAIPVAVATLLLLTPAALMAAQLISPSISLQASQEERFPKEIEPLASAHIDHATRTDMGSGTRPTLRCTTQVGGAPVRRRILCLDHAY